MSKLDKLKQLEQATPTFKPVARDVVKSVPIGKPETIPSVRSEQKTTVTKPKPAPKVTEIVEVEPEILAMPPTRDVEPRVQVIFRPTVGLNDRLKDFCITNRVSIQGTCSLALEEFLNRRSA